VLIPCSKHIAKQLIVGVWQCFAVSGNKDEGKLFHQTFVSSILLHSILIKMVYLALFILDIL
jgi:hypothetical protein